ncbi:hypothetical protein COCOBI_01-2240 [Coccomyxa sp. Obi]|nr:hypothetical protein COCOBI_01-2240 [Coccomyxa sp. Obi]
MLPGEQALAAFGTHPEHGFSHNCTAAPAQRGLINMYDPVNTGDMAFQPYSEVGLAAAQQRLEAELFYEAALRNLRKCQVQEQHQAALAQLPAWNTSMGALQAAVQMPPNVQSQQMGPRPQQPQQPQQRRRGRRGGVRQHAYRNAHGFSNRPNEPRPQSQPVQSTEAASRGAGVTEADKRNAAAAISGGTGVFLPNRPQLPPQPAHRPTTVPMPAPVPIPAPVPNPPLSRTAAISKARLQAAVGMAAGAPQAAYIPSSADLAASVRLAASGHLAHNGASLAHSAYYMPDAFLSGNSSLASTVFTPTSAQDMQGLVSQMSLMSQMSGVPSSSTMASTHTSPMGTPMATPRATEATTAALRELIYPSSEDSSHSSYNDLLFPHDAATLLARGASLDGGVTASQGMLLYAMRSGAPDGLPQHTTSPSSTAGLPSRGTLAGGFGHLWDTL